MTVYIPFSTSFHSFILSLVHLDPYSSDAVRANRKGSFCPRCLGNESVFAIVRNEGSFSTVKLEAREALKLTSGTLGVNGCTLIKDGYRLVSGDLLIDLRHHSLVWLYLRDWDSHTAVVLPESGRGWLEIAGDWLLESLPEVALYVLKPKDYRYSIADLANGDDSGFEVVRSATLGAMTRLELLMNPSISLEGLPLSDWFQSTFGIPQYQDRYILVQIGNRSSVLQPLRTGRWRPIQKRILKTELLVADHLAVLSTLLGHTKLSVTDIAVLMSTLWARACVLAPKISSRIIGSTSSLLLTYLLHVEDLGALVPVLNRIGGNIEAGDVCKFSCWSVDQDRFIRTLNLVRSQLGMELFPQFLTREAVHGEQDEVRHH